MKITEINISGHIINAEVADSPASHLQGLMNRTKLPWSSGMLFVYPTPYRISLWMKNTQIPLSVAFINNNRQIIHITDMQPNTTTIHRSPIPAKYALEVNKGWYEKYHIKAGDTVRFISKRSL
tara:strand:+ start:127 stop:495 length:369 start_codon:yes stop_codon:yes gene_type:complete